MFALVSFRKYYVVLSFISVAIKQNMISFIILPLNYFEPDLTQHILVSFTDIEHFYHNISS